MENKKTRKFWIDTDAGTDDAHAILIALAQPDVDVIGFSTVFGNASAAQSARNVLRILKLVGRLDIPVYVGVEKSLIGTVGGSDFHGSDGFGDIPDPSPADPGLIQKEHAVDGLTRAILKHHGEVNVLTLGPLTNLALALRLEPSLATAIQHCHIMGGNYAAVGNISASGEYNFYCDPEAANVVLQELECPVTLSCWETCVKAGLSWDFYRKMCDIGTTKAELIRTITDLVVFNNYTDVPQDKAGQETEFFPRPDPVAAAVAVAPQIVTSSERKRVKVSLSGSDTKGLVVVDWRNRFYKDSPEIEIIKEIDRDRFWQMLCDCLR